MTLFYVLAGLLTVALVVLAFVLLASEPDEIEDAAERAEAEKDRAG